MVRTPKPDSHSPVQRYTYPCPVLPAFCVGTQKSPSPLIRSCLLPSRNNHSGAQLPPLQPLTPARKQNPHPPPQDPVVQMVTLACHPLLAQNPKHSSWPSRAVPPKKIMMSKSPSTGQALAFPLSPTPTCVVRTSAMTSPPPFLSGPCPPPQVCRERGEERG